MSHGDANIAILLMRLAEQERDDALADAAAYRENRDSLEAELRVQRLRANELDTLYFAARRVGIDQEREILALRESLIAAHDEYEALATELEKTRVERDVAMRARFDPWAEREPAVDRTKPVWQ